MSFLPNSKCSVVKPSRFGGVKANFLSLSILDIQKGSGMCFQTHHMYKKDWVLYFSERDENLGNYTPSLIHIVVDPSLSLH